MQVIPAIDVEAGRSRVVFWPGASSGVGAPTDRPERIAERFVELGARVVHVVDFDGARTGAPGNLEAVGRFIVAERQALSDLGLQRRAKPAPGLRELMAHATAQAPHVSTEEKP